MTALAVVLDRQGAARPRAQHHLPGVARTVWSGGGVDVAVSGLDTAVSVEPDLVVVVAGRVPPARHVSPADDPPASRVARAWRRSGPASVRGLPDDVVIAVVRPEAWEVSVFRDLGGAVPAYLSGDGSRLVVATSLPALVRASDHRLVPDERWVRSYLDGDWPAAGISPYAQVKALAPGHLATGSSGGWATRRWDDFHFVRDVPADLDTSAERLRCLLGTAVQRRLLDEPGRVAVTLSGGLDSSSILATARAAAPEADLLALSLAFVDRLGDERSFQVDAARAAEAELVWVEPRVLPGPFGCAPAEVLDRYGAPPLAGNAFLQEGLAEAASAHGVQRVLDGEDGDGVLGAHPVYLVDVLAKRPVALLRELDAASRARGVSRLRLARRTAVAAVHSIGAGTWGGAHVAVTQGLVRGGYLSALTGQTYAQWERLPGAVAHPFLDRAVLEFALSVPHQHKVHDGVGKLLLRRAMAGRVPESILKRQHKSVLADPFCQALLGPQWDVLQDGLALARAFAPDIRRVPVVDRTNSGPNHLYAAYRTALVAYWREWLAHRGWGVEQRLASPGSPAGAVDDAP